MAKFGPIGDSDIITLTSASQAFALGTLAALNPAIRLIALNSSQSAWFLKFGTSGAVTVSEADGMRLIPAGQDAPVLGPVPAGATHVAILADGADGDAQLSYGGFDEGEFGPAGDSQIINVTQASQTVAIGTLAASQPAIRLVSAVASINDLRIKLGTGAVTADDSDAMRVPPGSVENPTIIPVTAGETHLAIFCEGTGGAVTLTPGGLNFGAPPIPPVTIADMKMARRTIADITAGGTIAVGDLATNVVIQSGTGTLAFNAVATFGADWYAIIQNAGDGNVTLDPSGAETIDGAASWILYPGGVILVQIASGAWHSTLLKSMTATLTASGTLVTPRSPNIKRGWGAMWGGGGGGGRSQNGGAGGGGGGGACVLIDLPIASFGASQVYTQGAGGAGATVDNTNGVAGGNSTLGSLAIAYGGGAGGNRTGTSTAGGGGGGGGGTHSAGLSAPGGASANGAAGGDPQGGAVAVSSLFGGGGGSNGVNDAAGSPGGTSVYGGSGGGGGASGLALGLNGGAVIHGGGGGGGSTDAGASGGTGGVSRNGGNGGNAGTNAVAGQNGSAPGGGGAGAGGANAGSGGNGRLRLTFE